LDRRFRAGPARHIQQRDLLGRKMSMDGIGICRVEKVKTRGGLSARDAHNRRRKTVSNAAPSRLLANVNLRPDLPESSTASLDGVLARLGNPRLRRNGVLGLEYVLTYSPQAADRIDPGEWAKQALAFVEGRHGRDAILSAHLHMDERTPHVHVVAAPVSDGRLKVDRFMGDRGKLRRLQDDYYQQVSSHFGLARRSENPTGRRHIPPAELRAQTQAAEKAVADARKSLEAAAKTAPIKLVSTPISAVSLLTPKGRAAFVDAVENAATKRIAEMREQLLRASIASFDQIRDLAVKALILKEENESMKTWQLQELRDIPLPRIAELYLGVEPRREGNSLVWETHDHKVVGTGPKWFDFKAPQGQLGGGAIDLTMHLLGCDFPTALRVMAADFPTALSGAVRTHHLRHAREETAAALASPKRLTFAELRALYAEPVASKLATVRRYLHDERMIPMTMVDRMISTGDIWGNKWGSCVFAHRTLSGEIQGCTVRATVGDFKQTLGQKRTAWFSTGALLSQAKRIVVTEAPIDVLSFETLGLSAEGDAILSTAGRADTEQLVALGRPLLLAQDADDAGEQQAQAFASAALLSGLSAVRRKPTRGKDWNEVITHERDKRQRTDREAEGRESQIARALESTLGGNRAEGAGRPHTGLPGAGSLIDPSRGNSIH